VTLPDFAKSFQDCLSDNSLASNTVRGLFGHCRWITSLLRLPTGTVVAKSHNRRADLGWHCISRERDFSDFDGSTRDVLHSGELSVNNKKGRTDSEERKKGLSTSLGLLSAQTPRRKIPIFSRNPPCYLESIKKSQLNSIYSHLFLGDKK